MATNQNSLPTWQIVTERDPLEQKIDYTKPGLFFSSNLPEGWGPGDPEGVLMNGAPTSGLEVEITAEGIAAALAKLEKFKEGVAEREKTVQARLRLSNEFQAFVDLVKQIVLTWAENLTDSDIRVAMIEPHERPLPSESRKSGGERSRATIV